MKRSTGLTCLSAALITAALLWLILHRAGADLSLPLNYLEDANIFLLRAKSIVEGNWVWSNPRLAMPFGANWMDFPMNVTVDSAVMWILSRFTSSAPLIVNLDWMIGLSATAALAAYGLMRLGFGRALAVSGAVVFALQPYSWFQGTKHLHCLSCAVPLVAVMSIEVAWGRLKLCRRMPAYVWIGCVLAGLSYAYVAFFSCFVLVCAAAIAWVALRDVRPFAAGVTLACCVGGVALVDLTPSLIYQARNGPNASMLFKSPVEAEVYGLKVRYLLTPSPDHPLGFVRRWERELAGVKFPAFLNENEYTRLGTVGSLGLLCLIGVWMGGRAAGSVFGPCAALTLLCILFATTGGLDVFFNTFLSPEIRAWARIFPFIGFFCVAAACAVAAPFVARLPRLGRVAVLGIVMVLAVFDQAVPSFAYDRSGAVYRHDAEFVGQIEKLLPAGSAVFELPYVDFPNDGHPGKLLVNDMLRPYLHSRSYGWSAAATSGTTSAEWGRLMAGLPTAEMLNGLVHRGFAGLWVDLAGYAAGQSPEAPITRELGAGPRRDSEGRFLFYDLRGYAPSQLSTANAVQAVFERGFYFAESGLGGVFRWSLRRGRVTLINPLPVARRVTLSMHLATADGVAHTVRVSWSAGSARVMAPGTYEQQVDVPAAGQYPIDFRCDCPGVRTANRTIYFLVSGFQVKE
jgi:phosphoglycerol transferase